MIYTENTSLRSKLSSWLFEYRIKNSNLFDKEYYLSSHEDVRNAGLDALKHYLQWGWLEGRDPSRRFSTTGYLELHPDVKASAENPLVHYVLFGVKERRVYADVQGNLKFRRARIRDAMRVASWAFTGRRNAASHFSTLVRERGLGEAIARVWTRLRREYDAERNKLPLKFGDLSLDSLREKEKEYSNEYREVNYQRWISEVESTSRPSNSQVEKDIEEMELKPSFSFIMPTYNSDLKFLESAVRSIKAQKYKHWQLCIADDASTDPNVRPFLERLQHEDSRIKVKFRERNGHISESSNSAIEIAEGDFLCFIDHDDTICPYALYYIAKEINDHPDTNLIYSDQDKITVKDERYDPYFKSRFNRDLLRSQNYIDHLATFRASVVRKVGGLRKGYEGSQDYDLVLRVVDESAPAQIRHIPHVLYHWRAIPGSIAHSATDKSYAPERSRMALRDHLARNGLQAQVLPPVENLSLHRVKYALPDDKPLVTVIVPTRDQLIYLRKCVDTVLVGTDYDNIELIVVDNLSEKKETLDYFEEITRDERVKIIKYEKAFNYSEMNNIAAREARGSVLCFLNNDVETKDAAWLEEMVSHALRQDVGAVGARLLYSVGNVQHSGIVLGYRGLAGHIFRYLPEHALGPWAQAALIQNFLAVTGACLVVRKTVFAESGGFNEKELAVVFNDVDLCLRIHDAGYRNVLTPYATLVHHESITRKNLAFESENAFLRDRWAKYVQDDPYFNPNYDRESESLLLPTKASSDAWKASA